jgi:hypothetical protein
MGTKSLMQSLRGNDYSDDLGVDGRIILKWMLRNNVAQDRDRWRAAVNTAIGLRVP